ncbi:MAG: hypothetical protein H0W09_06945 [Solirubrobacterales bacterium]|nr:hypothetical protein [Solirubrobacterales bacterium]
MIATSAEHDRPPSRRRPRRVDVLGGAAALAALAVFVLFTVTEPGAPTSGPTVGYAQVSGEGIVDAGRSVNVESSNVTVEQGDTFCFSDLPFDFEGANLLTLFGPGDFTDEDAVVSVGEPSPPCDRQTQAQVTAPTAVSGEPTGFFIQFYR